MPALAEHLAAAAVRLTSVTETPRLDAELLLAHALGITRTQLLARLREEVDPAGFEALIARRLNHEPIAYITGHWEFFSLDFIVRPPILVPRPETEHLVETVLQEISGKPARILDIGAGTGCVAIAIAINAPRAHVVATDITPQAAQLTRENVAKHGVGERLQVFEGDLFGALPGDTDPFDVVCSNPPYVETGAWDMLPEVIRRHEDPRALLAGPDGLEVIRRIAEGAASHLTPGGLLALEIGDGQFLRGRDILAHEGYTSISCARDLAGIPRIIHGRRDAR